jgi:hypothetical protein
MKMIIWINIVFFVLIVPVPAQDQAEVGINNLSWKTENAIISEACVGDAVQITFNTVNISQNNNLMIYIFEENDNADDDFVTEIVCLAKGSNSINWIIEFDENKYKTSKNELMENGFTIPEYYFIVKCGEYISEKSNIIKIYGYIDIKLVDENTKKVLSNRPYTIYFGNRTKHEGMSDENGRIIIRNAIIGDRYIMVGDEE